MKNKGQAAMEFLMTYGWAILVVIAAIAALAYFGVLDPARLLPERCQFPAGMDCIDKPAVSAGTGAANDGTVTMALRNNIGFAANITGITESTGLCTGTHVLDYNAGTAFGRVVTNNDVFRVQLAGCNLEIGDKYDGDVTVAYQNTESGLDNFAVGAVRGRTG